MSTVQQLSASQRHVLESLEGATFIAQCEIGQCARYSNDELKMEVETCVTSVLDKLWFIADAAGLQMRLMSKTEETSKDLYSANLVYGIYINGSKVATMHVKVKANRINDVIKAAVNVKKAVILSQS